MLQRRSGQQLSSRLANARQELKVDHAATLPSVRELAEYAQEDMSLTTPTKLQGLRLQLSRFLRP